MFEEFPAQKLTGLLSLITTKAKSHKDFLGLFLIKCQCLIPLRAKYYIFISYFIQQKVCSLKLFHWYTD